MLLGRRAYEEGIRVGDPFDKPLLPLPGIVSEVFLQLFGQGIVRGKIRSSTASTPEAGVAGVLVHIDVRTVLAPVASVAATSETPK